MLFNESHFRTESTARLVQHARKCKIILPLDYDANFIITQRDVDFAGPAGWRNGTFSTSSIDRTEDFVVWGESDATWAVFTLSPSLEGDLNGDCVVDTADLGILIANFGMNCPDECSRFRAACVLF